MTRAEARRGPTADIGRVSRRRSVGRRPASLVLGAGWVLAAAVALALGVPAKDAVLLLAYAVAGAGLVLGAAAFVLGPRRSRHVGDQVVVATLVPVAATVVGVGGGAGLMFVSGHDLRAVLVVLVAASSTGLAAAVRLARSVTQATDHVGEMARRLGDDSKGAVPGVPLPRELAVLAGELDVTAARLAESRSREQSLEQSRRELVAWVSHDLRTPLAGIRAMVEALEDGVVDDPENVARYHRTMRLETDRLTGLVDDLFELSRISAGALHLELQRVALGDLVSDAIAGASPGAAKKGVALGAAPADPALIVELSAAEMARVVRNLLDNAIRHTPAGGQIVVESNVDGDDAVVSVRDACGGIPADDLDRVFDLAYRGDRARTPGDDGGAGLGLAIARGLVEAHHGRIDVRNEAPGCRFTVRVPLAPAR
jgi:signal transduction histidine kinase